jgi:hypothetical protein
MNVRVRANAEVTVLGNANTVDVVPTSVQWRRDVLVSGTHNVVLAGEQASVRVTGDQNTLTAFPSATLDASGNSLRGIVSAKGTMTATGNFISVPAAWDQAQLTIVGGTHSLDGTSAITSQQPWPMTLDRQRACLRSRSHCSDRWRYACYSIRIAIKG